MAHNKSKGATSSALKQSIESLNSERFLNEPHSKAFATATIFAAALGLIAFWVWASLTPVYEVVTGDGTVKPNGFVVPVEHALGGRITNVLVDEGQQVAVGDVILTLDTTAIRNEIDTNRIRQQHLWETIQRSERILAHNFEAPAQSGGKTTTALPAYLAYNVAQVEHMRAARRVEQVTLAASRTQLEKTKEEVRILTDRTERSRLLFVDQRISRSALETATLELLRMEDKVEGLEGEIRTNSAEIDRSYANELELIAGFRNDAETRLLDARAQLTVVKQTISDLSRQLDETIVRASQEGVIGALSVRHAEEVLAPGAIIAEIVPQLSGVFADIEVSASKIGGIKVGAEVKLKILAHDYTRFGHVDARVASISPNSQTNADGRIIFKVRVEFDRNALAQNGEFASGDPDRVIDPGMTAVADIRIGRKTVLAYLIKPLRAISDRAFSEG